MKEETIDDLIITNNQESTAEQTSATDDTPVKAESSEGVTVDLSEDIIITDDGIIKEAKPEDTKSLKQILDENIHEEDLPLASSGITLMKVLGGDFFTAQVIRRQIWLILLIAFFAIIYISNRYSCQKSQLEVDKLTKELQDAKYKVLSTNSALTERSRESHVLEVLKQCGDSSIHIADEPPYLIKIEK